jgi:hypothetical protein
MIAYSSRQLRKAVYTGDLEASTFTVMGPPEIRDRFTSADSAEVSAGKAEENSDSNAEATTAPRVGVYRVKMRGLFTIRVNSAAEANVMIQENQPLLERVCPAANVVYKVSPIDTATVNEWDEFERTTHDLFTHPQKLISGASEKLEHLSPPYNEPSPPSFSGQLEADFELEAESRIDAAKKCDAIASSATRPVSYCQLSAELTDDSGWSTPLSAVSVHNLAMVFSNSQSIHSQP